MPSLVAKNKNEVNGDAVLMIEHMEKTGTIEQTGQEEGTLLPPTRMWQSVMAYDKIKNNERVRGKFS